MPPKHTVTLDDELSHEKITTPNSQPSAPHHFPHHVGQPGQGMNARAQLATEYVPAPDGHEEESRSRVSTLRSEAPLMLRLTMSKGPEPWAITESQMVRVCIAAGAAGPVGGDHLQLIADVGAGSTLFLSDISATLLLPGPHGEQSRIDTRIQVGVGATLIWLPEPIIAAAGCNHLNTVHIDLEPGSRLLMREELLLGRHGELPGTIRQHVRVSLDGQPLYHQHLDLGPDIPGWDSPAIAHSHRALGSILTVDPAWSTAPPPAQSLTGDAALLPLSGPAVLISALAGDSLQLRQLLGEGLKALGPPWTPA